jgi:hypothetical protein
VARGRPDGDDRRRRAQTGPQAVCAPNYGNTDIFGWTSAP